MRRAVLLMALLASACTPPTPTPEPRLGTTHAALEWAPHPVLSPAGASADDHFGEAVLLDDTGLFVGAPGAPLADPGAVHTFTWSPTGWLAGDVLRSSDGAAGPRFGRRLSRDGDRLAVAYQNGAYVFDRIGGSWIEQARLAIPEQCDAVSVRGDVVALGAPTAIDGVWVNGAAYVFEHAGGTWSETQRLLIDTNFSHRFGSAVQVTGPTSLMVGAINAGHDGAVFTYERIAGTWTVDASLTPSATALGEGMGGSLALEGDRLVVGGGSGLQNDGLFVFERVTGSWTEQAKLEAPRDVLLESFGGAVALRGDTLVAGWPGRVFDPITRPGAAVIYTRAGGLWVSEPLLEATPRVDAERFGAAVGVRSGMVVVGAPDAAQGNDEGAGAVHTFLRVGVACSDAAACASGHCVDGVCCDRACDDACEACDHTGSSGVCAPVVHGTPAAACGAYVCHGQEGACPTTCVYDTDCGDDHWCPSGPLEGDCVPKGSLGQACGDARECVSGRCTDGVCCDAACDEACASCTRPGEEGVCGPVAAGTPSTCAPFVCDGLSASCPESCIDETACPAGFACHPVRRTCSDGPMCDGDHTLLRAGAPPTDCTPYRCSADDACRDRCTTSAECVLGSVCDADGRCVQPASPRVVQGCACRLAGPKDDEGRGRGAAAWLALLWALARRRRAIRRRP